MNSVDKITKLIGKTYIILACNNVKVKWGHLYFFRRMVKTFILLGDLDRELTLVFQYISLYGVKSDGMNCYVHYVKKK